MDRWARVRNTYWNAEQLVHVTTMLDRIIAGNITRMSGTLRALRAKENATVSCTSHVTCPLGVMLATLPS